MPHRTCSSWDLIVANVTKLDAISIPRDAQSHYLSSLFPLADLEHPSVKVYKRDSRLFHEFCYINAYTVLRIKEVQSLLVHT